MKKDGLVKARVEREIATWVKRAADRQKITPSQFIRNTLRAAYEQRRTDRRKT